MASAAATYEVVVDPEFASLITPPTADELALLEESLVREGCREPLRVMADTNILLDGHNRYAICTRLGIPCEVKTIDIATRDEALLWIIENQLGRRNLADIDRIALVAKREPLLRARAAARQATRSQLPQNSAEANQPLETREVAASAARVSHDTYAKGKRIIARGTPELVQAVRDGDTSIHAAAAVAELPADEQREVVAEGKVRETAKVLAGNRRKSTGDTEWYTPDAYLDAARKVLGQFDLDPASCTVAQKRVRAKAYYDKYNDGLSQRWQGAVWLNPPFARGLIGKFVTKLVDEHAAGNVTSAILLTNNETDATWFQLAMSRATHVCFPQKRIRFWRPHGKPGSPLQGQTLFYYGPDGDRFVEVFGKLGRVVVPVATVDAAGGTGGAKDEGGDSA